MKFHCVSRENDRVAMQIFYHVGEISRLFCREKMAFVHGEKKKKKISVGN